LDALVGPLFTPDGWLPMALRRLEQDPLARLIETGARPAMARAARKAGEAVARSARRRGARREHVGDVLDDLELAVDAALPLGKVQALGGAGVDLRQVEIAGQLERVDHALAQRRGVETQLGELLHPHGRGTQGT